MDALSPLRPGRRTAEDARVAAEVARRYRLAVDFDRDAGPIVRCVELPAVACNGCTVDEAVYCARYRISRHLRELLASGQAPPVPLMESDGPLGGWAGELEFGGVGTAEADLIAPPADALRRIAEGEAGRYRIYFEQGEDGGAFVAAVAELPDVTASAADAGAAVEGARSALVERLLGMLGANELPPEPMRDRERREVRRPRTPGLARVA
jgi:predicted RNase H-like HicB family nuclease